MLYDRMSETVKLIDFGMSKILKGKDPMNTNLGTPYYIAPEIIDGMYDERCDLWSVGVITYMLISGSPPFHAKTHAQLYSKIKRTDFDFEADVWKELDSFQAESFIMGLLEPNLDKRMTI
jgi:calcium-dependent protein kinase